MSGSNIVMPVHRRKMFCDAVQIIGMTATNEICILLP